MIKAQTLIPLILENKGNATSHANIGSLKSAIKEEWNKTSEELILKPCKLLRRRVDTIIKKIVALLNKFSVFCQSTYFVVNFYN